MYSGNNAPVRRPDIMKPTNQGADLMRRPATHVLGALVLAAAGLLAFSGPAFAQPNLENMFLDEDTDSFDPGLAIGEPFPAIRAIHDGQEITNLDAFMGERGVALFAVRSADW